MDLSKTALFEMMKGRFAWLGERQQVLARNIANADTQGYTRQRVTFSNQGPTSFSQGIVGVDIERVYDRYLETQIISSLQANGRWDSQQSGLERI